jgi:hypothetical protein
MAYKEDGGGASRRPGSQQSFSPMDKELTNPYMISLGNFKRYTFSIEKKEHHFLEVVAKDQRRLKFKFESPTSYYRMSDAMARMVEISKQKDSFAFDFAAKIWEMNQGEEGKNLFMNDDKLMSLAL